MQYELKITGHKTMAYLGLYEHEQRSKREIIINITISFLSPPIACITDEIDDTFCYDSIIRTIDDTLSSKRFKLIEHITQCLYNELSNRIQNQAKLSIEVIKPSPNDKIAYSSFSIID